MENYLPHGLMGYYGLYYDSNKNEKIEKANKLVDEYNSKINTFETEKENDDFRNKIKEKINSILKTIK